MYKEYNDYVLGIKKDKDYKLYGGGTGVNLVFDKTNFKL